MKTTQKGFIVPLLIVIIALLLAGGGVYVYMQQKQANQPTAGNSTAQTASTTQTSNAQTADWKTYTDNQYGFEIKYPPLLSVTTEPNQTIIEWGMSAYAISVKENVNSLDELKSLMEKPIALSISRINGANSEINWKDTTVSGEKAIEMSYEIFAGGDNDNNNITHQTGVIKGTTAYIIIWSRGSETEYYQILSTFKFTK